MIDCFDRWGMKYTGYTFANSAVGLYQKFGFWPRFLTAVMSKTVETSPREQGWTTFSKSTSIVGFRNLTDSIYSGLDVTKEIRSVADQRLGWTVMLHDDSRLAGFAVCHSGPGSEAGSGTCYIKFAAASESGSFQRLLGACEQMAAEKGVQRITAGINLSRVEAYRLMLEHGYRTDSQGVSMHLPNESGFSRPGVYIIDDWR